MDFTFIVNHLIIIRIAINLIDDIVYDKGRYIDKVILIIKIKMSYINLHNSFLYNICLDDICFSLNN